LKVKKGFIKLFYRGRKTEEFFFNFLFFKKKSQNKTFEEKLLKNLKFVISQSLSKISKEQVERVRNFSSLEKSNRKSIAFLCSKLPQVHKKILPFLFNQF